MDVDPAQTGVAKRPRQLRHQDCVGREREVAHARHRGNALDNFEQVGAQRRLAAGQPELAESHRDCGAHHLLDLGRIQHLGTRQKAQAFQRHAVDAAQIAAIGYRDPEVIDFAIE